MELIYCRGTADFERCGAALGRYFLKRGISGLHDRRKIQGRVVAIIPRQGAAFLQRPARPPELNDLAYTEKVIFQ